MVRTEDVDPDLARHWVLQMLHPGGAACPDCGSRALTLRQAESWRRGQRVRCAACGRWFCATSATPFEDLKLGWRQISLAIWFTARGCTPSEISERIGCHPRTVSRFQRRIQVAP